MNMKLSESDIFLQVPCLVNVLTFFKEKHYADNSINSDDDIKNLIVMVCMESKLLG